MSFPSLEAVLVTLGVAALPVSELRGAIPLAIAGYDMAWPLAYLVSVLGNLAPVIAILLVLEPMVRWLSRVELFHQLFEWLFARTRRRFSATVERFGAVALVLVVAVPLPVTGAWTGSLLAFLYGVPIRTAFPLIGLGVLTAGVIVTLSTLGVIEVVGIS